MVVIYVNGPGKIANMLLTYACHFKPFIKQEVILSASLFYWVAATSLLVRKKYLFDTFWPRPLVVTLGYVNHCLLTTGRNFLFSHRNNTLTAFSEEATFDNDLWAWHFYLKVLSLAVVTSKVNRMWSLQSLAVQANLPLFWPRPSWAKKLSAVEILCSV